MKRFSQQFKKQSESIRMRASEKHALEQRLLSYMEYHPLPKEVAVKKEKPAAAGIVSEPFRVFKFNPWYLRGAASTFAIFFVVAIPIYAEKAVPGDTLYPVKIQFNEEIRSGLALSPYAKVAWETERVERRITEARLLADEGKLTEEAETQVAEAVKTHTDTAQREIAQLRQSDSDAAAIAEITFASALAVQSDVLAGHIEKNAEESNGTPADGHSVVALAQVVADARVSAEAVQQGSAQLSYEKLLAQVELQSTSAYELFASVKKEASEEEITNIERRLSDIQRKVEQAKALKEGIASGNTLGLATMAQAMAEQIPAVPVVAVSTSASSSASSTSVATTSKTAANASPSSQEAEVSANGEAEAIVSLKLVLTDIQKLMNYMTHIDVRKNVSINDLVPLTPTDEERATEILRLFDETKSFEQQVATHELQSRLQAKITRGVKEIDAKLALVTIAMQKNDLGRATTLVTDAHTLAGDIVKLTANEPIKAVIDETTEPVEVEATSTVLDN